MSENITHRLEAVLRRPPAQLLFILPNISQGEFREFFKWAQEQPKLESFLERITYRALDREVRIRLSRAEKQLLESSLRKLKHVHVDAEQELTKLKGELIAAIKEKDWKEIRTQLPGLMALEGQPKSKQLWSDKIRTITYTEIQKALEELCAISSSIHGSQHEESKWLGEQADKHKRPGLGRGVNVFPARPGNGVFRG